MINTIEPQCYNVMKIENEDNYHYTQYLCFEYAARDTAPGYHFDKLSMALVYRYRRPL